VRDQRSLEFCERTDDALEGVGDVGEVGDAAADDEDLPLRVRRTASDEVDWCSDRGALRRRVG
jgi:hypothetical protein